MQYFIIFVLLLLGAIILFLWLSARQQTADVVQQGGFFLPSEVTEGADELSELLGDAFQLLIRPDPAILFGLTSGVSPDYLIMDRQHGRPLGLIVLNKDSARVKQLLQTGLPVKVWNDRVDSEAVREAALAWQKGMNQAHVEPVMPESPLPRTPLPEPQEELPPLPPQPKPASRTCDKCGSTMQRKKVVKGQHAGKRFWVCGNYPECRTLIPIQSS
ncbi:topoisomerase DNA-binding C4 zinc finger domain-containing protein [Magnetococcus sp. PR-3]|uniref:topoisomerase DNA-binding C4 zinc finger domain-containing protein n=1 Tax=Magnetococcus sp. PR-3 TaxID=3120355 RepID=UPI002FCE5E4B